MQLQGKTALVTGGTRGIGKAIVEAFAAEGANVYFTYVGSVEPAKAIEDAHKDADVTVKSFQADAASFASAQEVVDAIVEEQGALHIIVNNAGITKDNLLLRMSEEQFDQVIETNLKSIYNYTKAASRTMMKQRAGVFINLSSIVGVNGNAGQANYAASKAGVIGFSKSIAQELGSRNIRTNVIAPGFIQTEMTEQLDEKQLAAFLEHIPLNRPGAVEDIANAAVFLASDKSSYITGQTIHINGGMIGG